MSIPNVVTKGVTPALAINNPLASPMRVPQAIATATASAREWPCVAVRAATVPVKLMFAATDRSNPPTTSANVWPTATTVKMAATRDMFSRFSVVANECVYIAQREVSRQHEDAHKDGES